MSADDETGPGRLFPNLLVNGHPLRTYSRRGRSARRLDILPPLRTHPPPKKTSHNDPRPPLPQDDREVESTLEFAGGSNGELDCQGAERSAVSGTQLEASRNSEGSQDEDAEESGDNSTLALPPTPAIANGRWKTSAPIRRGHRSIRRRPFLITKDTPPRGYKKLKSKVSADAKPMGLKDRPGDGFSDGETLPSGMRYVTHKRKPQSPVTMDMGALDLTQSVPTAPTATVMAKKRKKVRRSEDNSFNDVSEVGLTRSRQLWRKVNGERARMATPTAGPDLAILRSAGLLPSTQPFPGPETELAPEQVDEPEQNSPPTGTLSTVERVACLEESRKEKDANPSTAESLWTNPLPVQENVAAHEQGTGEPDQNEALEATQASRPGVGAKQKQILINGTPAWLLQALPETPQSLQETFVSSSDPTMLITQPVEADTAVHIHNLTNSSIK